MLGTALGHYSVSRAGYSGNVGWMIGIMALMKLNFNDLNPNHLDKSATQKKA